jgi:hypothetical protein
MRGTVKNMRPPRTRDADPILWAICALGLLTRALVSVYLPNTVHPDEIFQYVEQANRLLTGRGLVPWEYVVGARSWLLPAALTPALTVGRLLSPSPSVQLGCVTGLMIAFATLSIVSAYHLGARAGSRRHARFAAFLTAIWCETVYMSPHVLADTVSAGLLAAGLAAITSAPRRRNLLCAGLLLGFALVVRIQLAPAIALAALYVCRCEIRARWVPVALGMAAPVLLAGGVDWFTWGAPFRSFVVYLQANQGGVAGSFGAAPPGFYLACELAIWGAATPLVLLSAALGAKRLPLVALVLVAIELTFALVGHKEYRFQYPALVLAPTLCGVGTADMLGWWLARRPTPRMRRVGLAACLLAWSIASATSAMSPLMRAFWRRDAATLQALRDINDDPQSCGLAVNRYELSPIALAQLRPQVTLYGFSRSQPAQTTAAFNEILFLDAPRGEPAMLRQAGYLRQRCYDGDGTCLFRRPGRCDPLASRPLRIAPTPETRKALHGIGLASNLP